MAADFRGRSVPRLLRPSRCTAVWASADANAVPSSASLGIRPLCVILTHEPDSPDSPGLEGHCSGPQVCPCPRAHSPAMLACPGPGPAAHPLPPRLLHGWARTSLAMGSAPGPVFAGCRRGFAALAPETCWSLPCSVPPPTPLRASPRPSSDHSGELHHISWVAKGTPWNPRLGFLGSHLQGGVCVPWASQGEKSSRMGEVWRRRRPEAGPSRPRRAFQS